MGDPAQHFDLQIIRSWRNAMPFWAVECSLNGKYSGLDGVDSGSYFGPGIALNAVPTGFKCSSLHLGERWPQLSSPRSLFRCSLAGYRGAKLTIPVSWIVRIQRFDD